MGSQTWEQLVAHVVWSVRGRRELLLEPDDPWWESLLRRKATEVGAAVLAFGAGPDHVHVLVQFPAACALSEVVRRLKGASARAYNLEHPGGAFGWQDGFFARSCNPGDSRVLAYVRGQRQHHRTRPGLESWARHQPGAAQPASAGFPGPSRGL